MKKIDSIIGRFCELGSRRCGGSSGYATAGLTADNFSLEFLLGKLDILSEHDSLAMVGQVETAMYVWRRKARAAATARCHRGRSTTTKI